MNARIEGGDVADGHDHGGREALRADDGLALLALERGHHAIHGRDHDRLAHVVAHQVDALDDEVHPASGRRRSDGV